jgi:hypothetical protein
VDALHVELPPSQPIKDEIKESFQQTMRQISRKLESITFPDVEEEAIASSGR